MELDTGIQYLGKAVSKNNHLMKEHSLPTKSHLNAT